MQWEGPAQPLVSIDDKVAAELVGFLVVLNELAS